MNILHITKKYPNALGGDAIVVSNLEKQQWQHHHKVAILTSNCDDINVKSNVHTFGLKDTPAALDTITLRRLASLAHLFFKSFTVIRKERPDVIHSHSIDMAFAASFAARWFRVPMVHTFHVVTFHDQNQSWLRRKTELWFKRGANPKVVTAPDEADVKHLQAAGVANAQLLPNGIDLKFWHRPSTVKNEVFTFITVGRLEEQKGYEYLIRAVADLKQRTDKPFRVRVVGSGSLESYLKGLTAQLRLQDAIEFMGRKTPEEVRSLYAASDAAVWPSLWEAAALTIYEAWALRLPVITTRAGIFQEEPKRSDRVEVVEMRDHKSLAKGMLTILTDTKRREAIAERGNEIVQGHAWSKVYAIANDIYTQVLPKPKSTPPAVPILPAAAPTAPAPRRISERSVLIGLTLAAVASLAAASLLSGIVNAFVTLPLTVLVPGLLLRLSVFRELAGKSLAATLPLATALGLLLITVESLGLNWLLPLFGIDDPLRTLYIVPLHIAALLLLLALYLQKVGTVAKAAMLPLGIGWMATVRFVVPLLLPVLAAAGAFRLNNGFGNEVAVAALVAMATLAVWFVIRPGVFNPVWLIFTIALGLLLTTSLRSWYVSGFDISQEFQVFNLTLQNHHWDLGALPGNAYNACLTLTTLPTALQQMVGITPEYIFKFLYQIAFALTVVVIYLLGRRFADTRGAFLVGLFFVAQAQFIGTMPAIVRQQIGLLFFALIMFLLIEASQKLSRSRIVLLGLLSTGMVFAHYSTTYVTIFFLLATAVVLWAIKVGAIKRRLPAFRPVLSAATVTVLALVLMAMSYLWYSVINASSSNVSKTLSATWSTIVSLDYTNGYKVDEDGTKTRMLLGGDRATANAEDVGDYKNSLGITEDIRFVEAEELPAKNEAATWASDRVRDVLAIVVKVLLPISPLLLLMFKRTRTEVADVAFLGLGALVTFVTFMFLPVLTQSYNIERVLQQALILLSLTGLWALWYLLPARRKLNTILTTVFVLVYFVFSPGTGLVNQLIGGTMPRMNMNSLGEEYDKYYVHESEVKSAEWIRDNCQGQAVWADRYATLRVTAYGGVPYDSIRSDILKAKQGCLMFDRTNTQENLFYASYKKRPVRYSIPAGSFDQYDRMYTNGQSHVYQY